MLVPPNHGCLARYGKLVGDWHGQVHCPYTREAWGLVLVGKCRGSYSLTVNPDSLGHLCSVVMGVGAGEDPGKVIWTSHSFYEMLIQKQILICSLIVQFSKYSPMPTDVRHGGHTLALPSCYSPVGEKEANVAMVHGRLKGVGAYTLVKVSCLNPLPPKPLTATWLWKTQLQITLLYFTSCLEVPHPPYLLLITAL